VLAAPAPEPKKVAPPGSITPDHALAVINFKGCDAPVVPNTPVAVLLPAKSQFWLYPLNAANDKPSVRAAALSFFVFMLFGFKLFLKF
jgi:hypothetical protein